jgi:RNA polymerase sigma factor (sigma-70 family)
MNHVIDYLRHVVCLPEGADLTDGQLLESFLTSRHEAAFAALLRRHGPMVFRVCRRVLGNSHDAEDAFQATFVVLARKAASIRPREMVGNWLYGVAYRTALDARSAQARRRAIEKQVIDMPHPQQEPEVLSQELHALIDQALSRLPDKYRLPVVLCELEGRSRKEVARQLHLPEGTLSSRLATARRMLASRLTRGGLTLSSGALAAVLAQQTASAAVPTALVVSTLKAATLVGAGQALTGGVLSAHVTALTNGVLKAMFLTKLKTVTAVFLTVTLIGAGLGLSGYLALAEGQPSTKQGDRSPKPAATAAVPADRELTTWVDKRVQEWQPTREERVFDEIGWAKDIQEALRLGKANGRPIFLFTHKGHMDVGRC